MKKNKYQIRIYNREKKENRAFTIEDDIDIDKFKLMLEKSVKNVIFEKDLDNTMREVEKLYYETLKNEK